MSDTLSKAFEVYVPATLEKSTGADGKVAYHLVGPVGADSEDMDGEILDKAGVWNGLNDKKRGHKAMGGHVDFEHMFTKSLKAGKPDWDYVIGKGVDWQKESPKGPTLRTELLAGKDYADKVIRHCEAGGSCGYSIFGHATKRDDDNPKRVMDTVIPFVTVTLTPKNYDAQCSFGAVVKSLVEEVETGAMDGWLPEAVIGDTEPAWFRPALEKAMGEARDDILKAFTTGEGIVNAGDTGGQTLRRQSMAGDDDQVRCQKCNAKNLKSRKKCRKCGADMGGEMSKAETLDDSGRMHPDLAKVYTYHENLKAKAFQDHNDERHSFHAGAADGILYGAHTKFESGVISARKGKTDRINSGINPEHMIYNAGRAHGLQTVLDHRSKMNKSAGDELVIPAEDAHAGRAVLRTDANGKTFLIRKSE